MYCNAANGADRKPMNRWKTWASLESFSMCQHVNQFKANMHASKIKADPETFMLPFNTSVVQQTYKSDESDLYYYAVLLYYCNSFRQPHRKGAVCHHVLGAEVLGGGLLAPSMIAINVLGSEWSNRMLQWLDCSLDVAVIYIMMAVALLSNCQCSQPWCLLYSFVCCSHVHSLWHGCGHGGLKLATPADGPTFQNEDKACGGPCCLQVTGCNNLVSSSQSWRQWGCAIAVWVEFWWLQDYPKIQVDNPAVQVG